MNLCGNRQAAPRCAGDPTLLGDTAEDPNANTRHRLDLEGEDSLPFETLTLLNSCSDEPLTYYEWSWSVPSTSVASATEA